MKIAFTDVETTGLNPHKHEILEIGCVIFDDEIGDTESFSIKVKPEHIEDADPRALACNGYTPEAWADAIPLLEAMQLYAIKVHGLTFCAHNVTFDYGFIQEALRKTDVLCTFGKYKFDTMIIAWTKYKPRGYTAFSLKTMCEVLGIEPENEVHGALAGATKCYEIYQAMMQ